MCEKAKNKKQTNKTKNKNKTNQNQTNKPNKQNKTKHNKTKQNQPNKQSNKSVRYRRVHTKQWRHGSQKYFPQPFAQSPPSRLPSAEAASDGQRPLSEPLDSAPYQEIENRILALGLTVTLKATAAQGSHCSVRDLDASRELGNWKQLQISQ